MRPAYPLPPARHLRVFAFDPKASESVETAVINHSVVKLPWDQPGDVPLSIGPTNEYLEVVDYDAPNQRFYGPVDLNDPLILAQGGLPPAEGRPQFHQQMVFAVAMKTILAFERALGRRVLWSREPRSEDSLRVLDEFIPRLRIYPHALYEANAFYSPTKTALLFGYFRAPDVADDRHMPGGWIFTCLSHDIIAHETAHAILHGMHRRSIRATNPDSLAIHEAFADIVALLQHFTMRDAVEHHIAASTGTLRTVTLLSDLAQQFGGATGHSGALRSGIDRDPDAKPDPTRYERSILPHERGAVLVAAVFDAFLTIFERRTADLLRIGTGASKPTGRELHPELVRRLANEAAKAADHVLRMCVRGLDYLPPIDARFGEYLRAIVTADADLVPDDPLGYRVAMAEAFRRRGIIQKDCRSMAPDSLRWEEPEPDETPYGGRTFKDLLSRLDLTPRFDRHGIFEQSRHNAFRFWQWLQEPDEASEPQATWESMLGIKIARDAPRTIYRDEHGAPSISVNSFRMARRAGPDGQELRQIIVEVTQRRRAFLDPKVQEAADEGLGDPKAHDFHFHGGVTLVVDMRDGRIRYAIRKNIMSQDRLNEEREFQRARRGRGLDTYFGGGASKEPFAFMHRA